MVHARPAVADYPARRIRADHPIEHRTSLTSVACVLLFELSVKTPWQLLPGVVQGGTEVPGRFAAAFRAQSPGNPGSGPLRRSSGGSGPCRTGARTSGGPIRCPPDTPVESAWQPSASIRTASPTP